MSGWIGVDLDGTLATYGGWVGDDHIGAPIPAMVDRVRRWIAQGTEVRIFTARIHQPWTVENGFHTAPIPRAEVVAAIEAWCEQHIGVVLPITNMKD